MFRELTEVEKIKIDGGKGIIVGYIVGEMIDAARDYAKNPYPVGAGCSAVE